MGPSEIFWTAAPIVFTGGGVYALFKWRLTKVEEAVTKMADACVQNRTTCNVGLGKKLDDMKDEFRDLFNEGAADRKELHKDMNALNVTLARLDQKLLNGHNTK